MALFGWWFMLAVAVFWSRIIIKRFYKFTIDGNTLFTIFTTQSLCRHKVKNLFD